MVKIKKDKDLQSDRGDILYRLIEKGLSDKVTSERAEGSVGASHADI